MSNSMKGLFVGLLIAIAAAAGGFVGFLVAIVLGAVGLVVGHYLDGGSGTLSESVEDLLPRRGSRGNG
ncbi:hypothetical protein [Terracoccus luteus]|jgi:uncharacterized membrane protein|uniref:Putative membrane protein n=1 Tax=Terracoccus luteus TaxID=53356 RepID=A0A495XZY3_9MICO|nr:hypothetical protein [Terracoccus luteus]MBB2988379.1 putative membrane protein [Terracoccus luteus]MCP2173991.1 putative membrane protein [Terracoccus luteus]RKT79502.1 hypothetical protein DFJ68_2975 [Terracoccus luteus]